MNPGNFGRNIARLYRERQVVYRQRQVVWNETMDTLLMNSLLYFSSGSEPPLVRLGFAYDHVATCIRHSTDVVVSLEEIARRLSYFRRKYKLVKELCEVFGCYFDSSTLKVVGTDEVWAEVDSLVPGKYVEIRDVCQPTYLPMCDIEVSYSLRR
ncbi:hypothetical protein FRX31_028067 [Thalictrum thalictroides]|uniref:Myb/SANT-like domain-containing protein n=1 Tax=Thalictrum thalictroides TaxID=46969 RepID=A0A7J6VDR2_THATH|nr:hypothetical protein FRX31_028067 [Thalictrum thalictroides]